MQRRVKITKVVLAPPSPINVEANLVPVGSTSINPIAKEELVIENPYVETDLDFKTLAEYELALARTTDIFDAQSGSAKFDELAILITLIAYYEQVKIEFPKLHMLDVIKYKMEMFEMTPQQLTPLIGTAQEVELYLANKQMLAAEKLDKLCKLLFIRFHN